MPDKLAAIVNPLLLTLAVWVLIAIGVALDQATPVQCVIERSVTRLDGDGNPRTVRVQLVGTGKKYE